MATPLKKILKRVARAVQPNKTVTVDGFQITGAIEDYGFLKALAAGHREPFTITLFAEAARPGTFVVDIGAHLGHFSLVAGRAVGTNGKVLAFEPHPRNLTYLRRNIADNHLSKTVEVVDAAVAAVHGEASFYADEFESDTSGLIASAGTGVVQVKTAPLSAYCSDLLPAVIKVDVEGAELQVLTGMATVLERIKQAGGPFTLLIESNDEALRRAGASSAQLVARLRSFGLEVALIDEAAKNLVALVDGAAPDGCHNLLCRFPAS